MKKKCTKCKKLKSPEEFSYRDKSKGLKRSSCKKCQRKYDNRKYRTDNNRKNKIKEDRRRNKEEKIDFLNRYKKKLCCEICGEKRDYVLQFHHKEDKNNEVSSLAFEGASLNRIKKEIRKCKVLCANCHIELHYLKRNNMEI